MSEYLLDTNHASKLMAGDPLLVDRLAQSTNERFGISTTVLAELYYAVYASRYSDVNRQRLNALLDSMILWPFDVQGAEEFGRIQAELRAKGQPIPPMDAQIAAVVRVNGLTLLTADKHFRHVGGLPVENWLESA